MITFALDTNIISFYMRKNEVVRQNFKKAVQSKSTILIAPFAYYEVRRGLLASNATRQLKDFDNLCRRVRVGELDNAILNPSSEIYSALRTKGWTIDEIDILIAAFCKVHDCTLVTNNTRHFEHIPGLALADWSAA
ncbi:MAG: type II toxin-antitoxin system VapC family toxin [Spirochaetaceae bacterium]|jgi:tRNA(fMet)-specific endonuclease VapC|nr:type II toxin-antitoxin system VapC family toxin [Spirochaetaceae bacterium]